jgi:NAD-dependent dihydropyrimidine dehydrogenase PreA subunit
MRQLAACVEEYCPMEVHVLGSRRRSSTVRPHQIDPILCIGCKKCLSKGRMAASSMVVRDAIAMVDTVEVEEVGPMAI